MSPLQLVIGALWLVIVVGLLMQIPRMLDAIWKDWLYGTEWVKEDAALARARAEERRGQDS